MIKASLRAALVATLLTVTVLAANAFAQLSPEAKARAMAQIELLQAEKAARTPAEIKVDSALLLERKLRAGGFLRAMLPELRSGVQTDTAGLVELDVKALVSSRLLELVQSLGGSVAGTWPEYDALRVRLPLDAVVELAGDEDVRAVRRAEKPQLNKVNTSEGDVAHAAAAIRATRGISGAGVKIGVLSDSVDNLAAVQASGDLPAVTILQDAPGNSGEGTAMLEIVHDLAPGASLYFATAWLGPASFASNIKALRDAGCKIIIDDVSYFNESPFQDDIISQAVDDVTATGSLYFSSAGNSGNKNDNTSGVWEGDFVPMAGTGSLAGATAHNFGGGVFTNLLTAPWNILTLKWSDPLGASSNDYDLYALDTAGNIAGASDGFQDGTQDPFEALSGASTLPADTFAAAIVLFSGSPRYLHLNSNRGRLQFNTAGQMYGHACATGAFGVAAVSAAGRTTAFTGAESVETFSSDGPRRVFYTPAGSPLTPGNLLASGGVVRNKPDIAAADGVTTATPGFNPFFGTSAAAPHAGAIAGLMAEVEPGISRDRALSAFKATAFDIEGAGWDRDSGWGLIMADKAVDWLYANPASVGLPWLPIMLLN